MICNKSERNVFTRKMKEIKIFKIKINKKDIFSIAVASVSCNPSSLLCSKNCCSGGRREVMNFLQRVGRIFLATVNNYL